MPSAQVERLTIEKSLVPKGYKKITSLNTAKGLDDTTAIPVGSRFAIIIAESQDVRFRDDATNPTASEGMKVTKDIPFFYTGNLATIKFIEIVAGATLFVNFYGEE